MHVTWRAILLAFLASCTIADKAFHFSNNDLVLLVDESKDLYVTVVEIDRSINVTLEPEHDNLVALTPADWLFDKNHTNQTIEIKGVSPGHVVVFATSNISEYNRNDFFRVTVMLSYAWETVSVIVGWLYFAAWSISFYPQIYENWKRKSVVGLNFDFVALNITGFALYSLFNAGLYWISSIQDAYFERHPGGLNPVLLNDIVFSFHACFATIITIVQCFVYEREDQRISWPARILLGCYFIIVLVTVILASVSTIAWLDFLYYCSYIKLSITLLKYMPQAYMNYRRKSTLGWSIGNVLLDFTGGILSMLQMIINSWNFDDWKSIFGDPTKFGLGLFSVIFDVLFICQHYFLYRYSPERYSDIAGSVAS